MRDREHELGRSRRAASPLRGREGDPERPDVESQIAALAAQVRGLGERLASRDKDRANDATRATVARGDPPPEHQPVLEATNVLTDRVLAAAESVGAEIRASAEQQAERIRAHGKERRDERIAELLAAIARNRATLAAVIGEAGEIERNLEIMRARMGALALEMVALEESLRERDSARR